MAFDNHAYRRNFLKDSLLHLEAKKEKLESEIRQLQKPEMNRMLAESLGTSNEGYRFQKMLLVLVQNGQLVTYHSISEAPDMLIELTSKYMRDYKIYRIGDAFYKRRTLYYRPDVSEDIPRTDEFVPTMFINGRYYCLETDYYSDELVQENIYYNFDANNMVNGIYQVLVEFSQYGGGVNYWGEYDEGTIEFEYKVYDSVPLYEFLQYRDDMLGEAEPEAEELADRYIYIQHTKQKRFEHEMVKSQWQL